MLPKNVAAFVPEERLRLLAANDGESLKVSEKSVVFERTTSERAGKLEGDVASSRCEAIELFIHWNDKFFVVAESIGQLDMKHMTGDFIRVIRTAKLLAQWCVKLMGIGQQDRRLMDGSPLALGAIGFVQHIYEADTLAGRQVVGRRQVAEQLMIVDCLEPFQRNVRHQETWERIDVKAASL